MCDHSKEKSEVSYPAKDKILVMQEKQIIYLHICLYNITATCKDPR